MRCRRGILVVAPGCEVPGPTRPRPTVCPTEPSAGRGAPFRRRAHYDVSDLDLARNHITGMWLLSARRPRPGVLARRAIVVRPRGEAGPERPGGVVDHGPAPGTQLFHMTAWTKRVPVALPPDSRVADAKAGPANAVRGSASPTSF